VEKDKSTKAPVKREKRKGYRYYCSMETIKEYMALPAAMKLEWLEEINRFSYYAMPAKNREIWEKFRKGEI